MTVQVCPVRDIECTRGCKGFCRLESEGHATKAETTKGTECNHEPGEEKDSP